MVEQSFDGSIVMADPDAVETVNSPDPQSGYRDVKEIPTVSETPGRYVNEREHSRGGMGGILLVHDAYLNRDIALKELLPVMNSDDATPTATPGRHSSAMLGRFLQEANITGQLEHPSIVPV